MPKRKPQKLHKTITQEELKEIIDVTKKKTDQLAYMLGFFQCMRVSEIVKLRPGDVRKDHKLIHIREAKGSKDRMIPIAPEVTRRLKHLPIGVGVRALQKSFKRDLKKALGRDDLTFHSLRHSGVTHYINKPGWEAFHVQRMAGHSRISTTQIYEHLRPEDLVRRMWGEKE